MINSSRGIGDIAVNRTKCFNVNLLPVLRSRVHDKSFKQKRCGAIIVFILYIMHY